MAIRCVLEASEPQVVEAGPVDSLVATTPPANSLDVLDAVQRRVLWLAMSIVHHAVVRAPA